MEQKSYLFIIFGWILLSLLLLVFFINKIPPFNFLGFTQLLLLWEESKLFFITLTLPLIIIKISTPEQSFYSYARNILIYVFIFLLLTIPITSLTTYFGRIEIIVLLQSHLLLIFIALFIISLSFNKLNCVRTYYFVFFLVFGILPVLYYLVLEFTKQSWSSLVVINPYRLFWQLDKTDIFYKPWLLQSFIWIIITVIQVIIWKVGKRTSV
jgi:hypothetical protein